MDIKLNQSVQLTIHDKTFTLTPKEFVKLNEELTKFINKNYIELHYEND